jgi:5-methylcytosine-specific restriction endonuclease McrA
MTVPLSSLADLSDHDLVAAVKTAAAQERHATVHLIASLTELDARRLYLREGCSSLFTSCIQVLHLSEHAAYGRIETARAARRFPVILDLLADGDITLTAVGLVAPHLTPENHRDVLETVRHKSKRDVEYVVAALRPRPDAAATVRKLPEPRPRVTTTAVPTRSATLNVARSADVPAITLSAKHVAETRPLAPERYKVQFTVARETYDKLRRAQDLLRHTIPNGDPAIIFDRALTLLIAEVERTKLAATRQPRPSRKAAGDSRHIPAAVKRTVWTRDGGRCAFVGTSGRCTETGFLEFHHVVPYAAGGEAVSENLELRCRSHNAYEAEQFFGSRKQLLDLEERSDC